MEERRKCQRITFKIIWSPRRTNTCFLVGLLDIEKISLIFADAKLSDEDRSIGRPGLEHYAVVNRLLLEKRWDWFNRAHCSEVLYK